MPSIKSREQFDKVVLDLLNQGKSDIEIANITGRSIHSVGDSRRRNNQYKISAHSSYDEMISAAVIVTRTPKAYPYRDQYGKLWMDVSEFFGI